MVASCFDVPLLSLDNCVLAILNCEVIGFKHSPNFSPAIVSPQIWPYAGILMPWS